MSGVLKYQLSTIPVRALDAIGFRLPVRHPIRFMIERDNWSIKWDGISIAKGVEQLRPHTVAVDDKPYLHAGRILHFGSQFQWVTWQSHLPRSNRYICTFFHGKREDDSGMARHVDAFMKTVPHLEYVVTAATLIERRLLSWGVPREKLVRIPIGVDTKLFIPVSSDVRAAARDKYGIGPHHFVIGSFQKDGVGWGEGTEPKLIKGPDILVWIAAQLKAAGVPVFVFLTGPARGYVKTELNRLGLQYSHEYLDDYLQLPPRFHVLDAYVNPSREEGGPKGILEAMASGIPVVSTRVGMAEDVLEEGQTGLLRDVGDVDGMVTALLDLYNNRFGAQKISEAARTHILDYDWAHVARAHLDQVYCKMLERTP